VVGRAIVAAICAWPWSPAASVKPWSATAGALLVAALARLCSGGRGATLLKKQPYRFEEGDP
jgi:hypothetical protein